MGGFDVIKGQLILKANYQAVNSSKKQTCFCSFWKKLKTPKRHFEINWPLSNVKKVIVSKFVAFTEYMNFGLGCNVLFKIPNQKNANF